MFSLEKAMKNLEIFQSLQKTKDNYNKINKINKIMMLGGLKAEKENP